jgi:hypothetical protein
VLTVENTVRIESCPARHSLASSCAVAGGVAVVALPLIADLDFFPPGLSVQLSGAVVWFWLDLKQEFAGEIDLG